MLIYNNGELIHVDNIEDVIEHYGVPGMRWGVRRAIVTRHRARKGTKRQRNELKRYKNKYKISKGKVGIARSRLWSHDEYGFGPGYYNGRKILKKELNLLKKERKVRKKDYKDYKQRYKEEFGKELERQRELYDKS